MKNSQIICGLFVVSLWPMHHSLPATAKETTGAAALCRPKPGLATLTHVPSGFFSIALTAFEAFQTGEAVELTWATTSETGSDYFTIERSTDGSTFAELATVAGGAPRPPCCTTPSPTWLR